MNKRLLPALTILTHMKQDNKYVNPILSKP